MYDIPCTHCGLRACICGYMYRGWGKEELERAITVMQAILKNPTQVNPHLLSLEFPLDYPHCDGNIRIPEKHKLTLWQKWKSRKHRFNVDHLQTGDQFRFRMDCHELIMEQVTEHQTVLSADFTLIDYYGNCTWTVQCRGTDGKEFRFTTSNHGETTPGPFIHPKYILKKG